MNSMIEKKMTASGIAAGIFLWSTMVLPRSYVPIKLFFLVIFLLFCVPSLLKKGFSISRSVLFFYTSISLIGVIWCLVGLVNNGAIVAIFDSLRLSVAWSGAFFIFASLLLRERAFHIWHYAVVYAGIFIAGMNVFAIVNHAFKLNLIPMDIKIELDMFVGLHSGYVQINSHNIGSLFFVASYLMAVQFRTDLNRINGKLEKFSLLMCLLISALSGRRALWLALMMVPGLIIALSLVSGTLAKLRGRLWLMSLISLSIFLFPVIVYLFLLFDLENHPTVSHLLAAFSAQDERSIQKTYLIDGFLANPVLGSGFGAYAGYLRSMHSPWMYELTYHQVLFNFGILGVTFICLLMAIYIFNSIRLVSLGSEESGLMFSAMIGIAVLAIGAYSNPYFGSFDFLLLLIPLPLGSAIYFRTKNRVIR